MAKYSSRAIHAAVDKFDLSNPSHWNEFLLGCGLAGSRKVVSFGARALVLAVFVIFNEDGVTFKVAGATLAERPRKKVGVDSGGCC